MKDFEQNNNDENVSFDVKAMWNRLNERIDADEQALHASRVRRKRRFYQLVAAILLPVILAGIWVAKKSEEPVQKKTPVVAEKRNLQNIQLTLSDGSVVTLGEEKKVNEADGKAVAIADEEGLAYNNDEGKSAAINKLQVPRGRKYMLQLADGSKVWLNAESTISYPVSFVGNTREVEISGEAFFQVSQNAAKPFIVHTGKADVQVLGTSFNVSSYGEELMKTTLVEGKVKVSNAKNKSLVLVPGEQAVQSIDDDLLKKNVDVEMIIAWKDDLFFCQNESLESIAKRLEREYDYRFVFKNDELKNIRYSVSLYQNTDINTVLKYLSKAGPFNYSVNGNEILVQK